MPSLSQEDQELLKRLNRRPDLKKRAESILSIAEDDGEGIVKADEAEKRITEEVRRMGNEVLTGWAESRIGKSKSYLPADGDITRNGQKNPLAQYVRRNNCIRTGVQTSRTTTPALQPECRNNLPLLFTAPAADCDRLRRGSRLRPGS